MRKKKMDQESEKRRTTKTKKVKNWKCFDKQSLHAVTMMLLLWFQSDVDDSVAILI